MGRKARLRAEAKAREDYQKLPDFEARRKERDQSLRKASERKPFLIERTPDGYEWGWQVCPGPSDPNTWALRICQVTRAVKGHEPISAATFPLTMLWIIKHTDFDGRYGEESAKIMNIQLQLARKKRPLRWYNVRFKHELPEANRDQIMAGIGHWLQGIRDQGQVPTMTDMSAMLNARAEMVVKPG